MIVDTDKNVTKTNLVDYSSDIAFSELRQSLFINPLSGDAGMNSILEDMMVQRKRVELR